MVLRRQEKLHNSVRDNYSIITKTAENIHAVFFIVEFYQKATKK